MDLDDIQRKLEAQRRKSETSEIDKLRNDFEGLETSVDTLNELMSGILNVVKELKTRMAMMDRTGTLGGKPNLHVGDTGDKYDIGSMKGELNAVKGNQQKGPKSDE